MSPPLIRMMTPGRSARPGSPTVESGLGDVSVNAVDVRKDPTDPGASHLRACVQLGELLPLDVVVELTCDTDEGRRMVEADRSRRMWSTCSLRNGSYVFEAPVPTRDLDDAATVVITVKRADPSVDMSIQPVLARREFPVPQ